MSTNFHKTVILLLLLTPFNGKAEATSLPSNPMEYRNYSLSIRPEGKFKIAMPSGSDLVFEYHFDMGEAVYEKPIIGDIDSPSDSGIIYRSFWDKIWLKDGSFMKIGGEEVPLTCIFVDGRDNRSAGFDSPLIPQLLFRITLVANDYTCTGPINPTWPSGGGKQEMWDTYVRFDVRDPTIMLPVDARLRYRWNEFSAIFVK